MSEVVKVLWTSRNSRCMLSTTKEVTNFDFLLMNYYPFFGPREPYYPYLFSTQVLNTQSSSIIKSGTFDFSETFGNHLLSLWHHYFPLNLVNREVYYRKKFSVPSKQPTNFWFSRIPTFFLKCWILTTFVDQLKKLTLIQHILDLKRRNWKKLF